MKTVYIELFFIDNILINFYFLYLSGTVLRLRIKTIPGIVSASLGAIYGFLQLTGYTFLNILPLKIILSVIMVYISYRPSKNTFFKLLLCFYGFSFVFAGIIMAFFYMTTTDSFIRTMFFLPIPLRFALLILLSGHFLKKRLLHLISLLTYCRQGISLYISCFKSSFTLSCYSDTGNTCSYFGKPVAFVDKNSLALDENTKNIIEGNISQSDCNINIVYIPYRAAGGEIHTAPGFKCDRAVISCGSKIKELCLYIALLDHDFAGEPCLINPALLD